MELAEKYNKSTEMVISEAVGLIDLFYQVTYEDKATVIIRYNDGSRKQILPFPNCQRIDPESTDAMEERLQRLVAAADRLERAVKSGEAQMPRTEKHKSIFANLFSCLAKFWGK